MLKYLGLHVLLLFSAVATLAQNRVGLSPTQIYRELAKSTVTVITGDMIGSGFFVTPDVIVTNYHVVRGAREVYCVTVDSAVLKVLGYVAMEIQQDLILLKVEQKDKSGKTVNMFYGDVPSGEEAYAMSFPLGQSKSVLSGIISAVQNVGGVKLLQTTVPISHGNSGGPLVNKYGEVVGVAVVGSEKEKNISFALPSTSLVALMKHAKSNPISLKKLKKHASSSDYIKEKLVAQASTKDSIPDISKNGRRTRLNFSYLNAIFYLKENEDPVKKQGASSCYAIINANKNGDILFSMGPNDITHYRRVSDVEKMVDKRLRRVQRAMFLTEEGQEVLIEIDYDGHSMAIAAEAFTLIFIPEKLE